jgi:hypothetical protein
MFSRSKKKQVRRSLRSAVRNPYAQKAIHDPQFRRHALEMLTAGRQAYRRFNKKGSGALDDRKFKRSLSDARSSLVAARRGGRSGKGKWALIAAVLGGVAWLWRRAGTRVDATNSDSNRNS